MSPAADSPHAHGAPNPSTTLAGVKAWLRERLDDGATCPACHQTVKMYRRRIHHSMARALVSLYRYAGTDWCYTAELWTRREAGDASKLRYWRLIEQGDEPSTWRVTDLGVAWIVGYVTVPSTALVYNGACYGLVDDQLTLPDALGEPFDLEELLAARPAPPAPTDVAPELFPEAF